MKSRDFAIGLGLVLAVTVCLGEDKGRDEPWQEPEQWAVIACEDLAELSDDELRRSFEKALSERSGYYEDKALAFGTALNEIGNRGGEEWRHYLEETVAKIRENQVADGMRKGIDSAEPRNCHDLDLLTVLRRMEGKEQPLVIGVQMPEAKAVFPLLPVAQVSIAKRKGEEDFMFTLGGDYRTGRLSRWRVLLWDKEGEEVPAETAPPSSFGGGIFNRIPLKEENWESALKLSGYLDGPLVPGVYQGRLAYHDSVTVANWDDPRGLVYNFSNVIRFEVVPRQLERVSSVDFVRTLVKQLPDTGPVQILSHSYPKEGTAEIPKESVVGQLIQEGWAVVPNLVRALKEEEISATQRAWGLGVLHTVSSLMDPTKGKDLLGPYGKRSGGFWISQKVNGQFSASGGGMGGYSTSSGGHAQPKLQKEFLEEWERIIAEGLLLPEAN